MTGHHAIYCAQSVPQTDSKWALQCMDLSTQQHLQGIQQAQDNADGMYSAPFGGAWGWRSEGGASGAH